MMARVRKRICTSTPSNEICELVPDVPRVWCRRYIRWYTKYVGWATYLESSVLSCHLDAHGCAAEATKEFAEAPASARCHVGASRGSGAGSRPTPACVYSPRRSGAEP